MILKFGLLFSMSYLLNSMMIHIIASQYKNQWWSNISFIFYVSLEYASSALFFIFLAFHRVHRLSHEILSPNVLRKLWQCFSLFFAFNTFVLKQKFNLDSNIILCFANIFLAKIICFHRPLPFAWLLISMLIDFHRFSIDSFYFCISSIKIHRYLSWIFVRFTKKNMLLFSSMIFKDHRSFLYIIIIVFALIHSLIPNFYPQYMWLALIMIYDFPEDLLHRFMFIIMVFFRIFNMILSDIFHASLLIVFSAVFWFFHPIPFIFRMDNHIFYRRFCALKGYDIMIHRRIPYSFKRLESIGSISSKRSGSYVSCSDSHWFASRVCQIHCFRMYRFSCVFWCDCTACICASNRRVSFVFLIVLNVKMIGVPPENSVWLHDRFFRVSLPFFVLSFFCDFSHPYFRVFDCWLTRSFLICCVSFVHVFFLRIIKIASVDFCFCVCFHHCFVRGFLLVLAFAHWQYTFSVRFHRCCHGFSLKLFVRFQHCCAVLHQGSSLGVCLVTM